MEVSQVIGSDIMPAILWTLAACAVVICGWCTQLCTRKLKNMEAMKGELERSACDKEQSDVKIKQPEDLLHESNNKRWPSNPTEQMVGAEDPALMEPTAKVIKPMK
jgi:hypothetical protein